MVVFLVGRGSAREEERGRKVRTFGRQWKGRVLRNPGAAQKRRRLLSLALRLAAQILRPDLGVGLAEQLLNGLRGKDGRQLQDRVIFGAQSV